MTSSHGLLLAVDIGSSSIKSSLYDVGGHLIKNNKTPLPVSLANGHIELALADLWEAFRTSVGSVISSEQQHTESTQIRGIGITTQMTGLILLDEAHRPIRKAILGVDQRGQTYLNELLGLAGGENIQAFTGCPLKGIYPTAKLLWLAEHEPENMNVICYLGGVKEYILWKLTGQWVTDAASASTTQLYHQHNKDWWIPFVEQLGINRLWLPTIKSPEDIAGYITPEAALELSLSGDIIVSVGTGDGPAANLATGSVSGDKLCISLGTTAVTRYMVVGDGDVPAEEDVFQQHFMGEQYFRGYRMEGAGSAIEHAIDDAELREILARILFSLYDRMKPLIQRHIFSEVRPIGGGAVNERWMRDIADLFQLPVVISESTDSTLGAAMLTAVSIGHYHSLEEAGKQMVRIHQKIDPDISRKKELHQQYERYVAELEGGETYA